MTIRRRDAFDTWRACAEAINGVIPDMAVSIEDIGEGAVIPDWVTKIIGGGETIDKDTVNFFKRSKTAFYAWHWYGQPKEPADAISNMLELGRVFNCPTFATEFMS